MAKAPIIARARMDAFMKHALAVVNGWTMMVNPIGTYGTDYLKRALIAFLGLGANVVEDAIYPTVGVDRDGNALDSGARYRATCGQPIGPTPSETETTSSSKERNWLPTPASGRFTMNLRLYWPRPEALDGTWSPPPVERVR